MKMVEFFETFKSFLFRGDRRKLLPTAEKIMHEYYDDVDFDGDSTPEERREIIDGFIRRCIEARIREEIEREKNNK